MCTGVVKTIHHKIGVFIDIGAVRDGFVHVSRLCDGFVKKGEDVVKLGAEVQARVVDVDLKQNRITLSMQSEDLAAKELESMARYKGVSVSQTPKEQAKAVKRLKRTAEKQEARNKRRQKNKEEREAAELAAAAANGGGKVTAL